MSESTGSCDHSPDRKFGTGIPVTPWKWVRCCTGSANSNPHPYPCIPMTHYHGFTRTHVMPYGSVDVSFSVPRQERRMDDGVNPPLNREFQLICWWGNDLLD